MPSAFWIYFAAFARRFSRPFPALRTVLAVAFVAVLAGACARAPVAPFAGADPSDPETLVPPTRYRSTVAPYTKQRPVDPGPWREQNERITPPERQ